MKKKQNRGVVSSCKNAEQYFGALAVYQDVYKDCDLTSMKQFLDDSYWAHRAKIEQKCTSTMQYFQDFFASIEYNTLYDLLQHDVQAFVDYLSTHNFVTAKLEAYDIKQIESHIGKVVSRYNIIMRLLFLKELTGKKKKSFPDTNTYLFTVANHFFDYCFRASSYRKFESLLQDKKYYPIIRLMYSVILEAFVQTGWKDWSEECLLKLADKAKSGKRLVYIAGGCDIYRLVERGIYNITIIDPFLPTQESFYLTDWEWFVRNTQSENSGISDVLEFEDHNIRMVRVSYVEFGTFTAKLSTRRKKILPISKTIWQVHDTEHDKVVGTVELERRFCNENDFTPAQDKFLLMSFNELYFVSTTPDNGGWHLDHQKMSSDLQIFIKQLNQPVGIDCITNIRKAEATDFNFCALGAQAS